MMASNSNQYVHSKQLFACSLSNKSTINHQKIILGTLGTGSQSILFLQSSNEGYKIRQYQLPHCFSMKLMFLPTSEDDRFISGGEKLQIFKSDDQKISHIADLIPKSKEFNGPTTSFDLNPAMQNRLVSCSVDPSIRVWDLGKKICLFQFLIGESDSDLYTIDISASKDPFVFAYLDNQHQIGIFDCKEKSNHQHQTNGINKINGKLSYSQLLWNKQTGIQLAAVDCETNTIDFFDMRQTNNKYLRIRTEGQLSRCEWFYQRNSFVTAGIDQKIILHEGDNMEPQYSLTKQFPIENICCNEELFGVVSDKFFEVFSFDM